VSPSRRRSSPLEKIAVIGCGAVALAGIGFDETSAELIADPGVSEDIHEVIAEGAFGHFQVRISGRPLPGNPKSSALTAMSVVRESRNSVAPLSIR